MNAYSPTPQDYTPKPWHLLFPMALIIAGGLIPVIWISIGLGLIALACIAWIVVSGLWASKCLYNFSIVQIAKEIKDMDPERYRALGIAIPELRVYPSHDGPIHFLENTDIRMEAFHQYLQESDDYQTTPQRDFGGEGTIARNQWTLITRWLLDKKYLIENSASGNHSWLWRNGRRKFLLQAYFDEDPIALINLSLEEIEA